MRTGLPPFLLVKPLTRPKRTIAPSSGLVDSHYVKDRRTDFRQRRCFIAADGFYEWKRQGSEKQPYFIGLKNNEPFAFAGLWEHWEGQGESIDSCTIIVTEANELLSEVHDRMPVILPRENYDEWL